MKVGEKYWLSTLTTAYARGVNQEPRFMGWLVPHADFTIVLRLNTTIRHQRIAARGIEILDKETMQPGFRLRVEEGYEKLSRHPVSGRLNMCWVGRRTPEEVAEELIEKIQSGSGSGSARVTQFLPEIRG